MTIEVTNGSYVIRVISPEGVIEGIGDVIYYQNTSNSFTTNKATIVDNDRIAGFNSENSNSAVYWTWTYIKSVLKAIYDALYVPLTRTINSKALNVNIILTQDDIGNGSTYVQTENNFTDANVTNLGNQSGVNTGDQVATDFDIKDLTDSTSLRSVWSGKQDALGFVPVPNTRTINGQDLTANRTFVTNHTKNVTFVMGGSGIEITTSTTSGVFKVSKGSNVTVTLDAWYGYLESGTSFTFKVQSTVGGGTAWADVTGWTGLAVSGSSYNMSSGTPTQLTLTGDTYFKIIVTAVSGTPTDGAVILTFNEAVSLEI